MCKGKCGSKCLGSMIMWTLLIVGGLNWGLVGIFNLDLVAAIFGDMSVVTRIVYTLVAVAAIGTLAGGCCCKKCKKGGCCKDGSCDKGACAGGTCEMKEDEEDEECASCASGSCDTHGEEKKEGEEA